MAELEALDAVGAFTEAEWWAVWRTWLKPEGRSIKV